MTTDLLQFIPFARQILSSSSAQEEVAAANNLANFYSALLEKTVPHKAYSSTEPTHIDGGIALSSQHALDCLKDPLRTVRFIKATYRAINDAITRFPNEQIALVYAGCGPGAPIIIPILGMFSPDQLSVTLIDINKSSLDSVSALIKNLNAHSYFTPYYLGDAVKYEHPANKRLHIVLSETMDKGLIKEPQVRITQNLAPQLVANGILIPETISIFTEHSFFSKEPYFDIYKNVLSLGPVVETRDRQLLFSITKDTSGEDAFEYFSDTIKVPANFEDTPDVCIFAEITIYGNLKLLKSQSLLSNPYGVNSLYNLSSNTYQLRYTTHNIPDWKLVENTNT